MAIEKEVLNQDLNNESVLTGNDENKGLAEGNDAQCHYYKAIPVFTDEDANMAICGIIKEIYGNNLANNYPENITPAVIDIVTDAVNRIKAGTKPLQALDVTFNFLYTAPGSIKEVLFGMAADMAANLLDKDSHNPLLTYVNWIKMIRGKKIYTMVLNSAVLATRSSLELALMGL